ncbi:hypothetical protein H112_04332 [Trichophyton rubrum D6]|uniref:Uncharacterized protein n=3 Tax=Trichophyton TaxID=5550 RepID=A0A080WGB1_TRIRC|nr:uncharacterized protein TERG_12099 [Trichophyton rubrum CBS 118892]EZF22838.1 hypothetical protein H100_04340 [Trichophyton rubrum MR850]EZF41942.1 hypothetical protein H102_04324 [Trichophyton rubrum CBS 100081]EZF52597.1 hypothetical protein H103_04333 [Trichophyton rubrum CBS 288.86]EZF63295.1 hypothetical protein H104_04322 [Trichophyton rubrum CBS 289.86]EZF73831.1 hypothetical protein H105_04349 [Trichophyton soudanense CBS 452.61]EZF84511.1 hypothetical protein H110_04327 [Trichophy
MLKACSPSCWRLFGWWWYKYACSNSPFPSRCRTYACCLRAKKSKLHQVQIANLILGADLHYQHLKPRLDGVLACFVVCAVVSLVMIAPGEQPAQPLISINLPASLRSTVYRSTLTR